MVIQQPSLPPANAGVVGYDLGAYHLQIPVPYLYTFYERRGNRWMESGRPAQKVSNGIVFDPFLPDMEPYGPDLLNNQKAFSTRHIYVSLSLEPPGYAREEQMERLLLLGYRETAGEKGLRKFVRQSNGVVKDTYFFEDVQSDQFFTMSCETSMCQVVVVYREYPELKVSYSYNSVNLSEWRFIRNGIKKLIAQFQIVMP